MVLTSTMCPRGVGVSVLSRQGQRFTSVVELFCLSTSSSSVGLLQREHQWQWWRSPLGVRKMASAVPWVFGIGFLCLVMVTGRLKATLDGCIVQLLCSSRGTPYCCSYC